MFGFLALALLLQPQSPASFRRALAEEPGSAIDQARDAQAAFERNRRYQLPAGYTSGGRCDERIGRFCYWYDDGDTTLPADPPAVRAARARLLATLEQSGASRPASDWLAGQRVRYLIEQDSLPGALGVARECVGTDWWCRALEGLALHAAGRYLEANRAFDQAVARMDEPIRCAWHDWTEALDGRLGRRSRNADCPGRIALADSLFWLGQPLLTRPGNDLRSEHFSRRVMAALNAVSRSPHGIPWGDDMEELLLRYGWSTRYSATGRYSASLEGPSVTGHQRSPAFQFLPLAAEDSGVESWLWRVRPDRPRARYAPPYADAFAESDRYQIARFPRAGGMAVAASLDRPSRNRERWTGTSLDVALALSTGPGATTVSRATGKGGAVLVSEQLPAVASIEATAREGRGFLRHRTIIDTISRSGALVVSDPLLFRVEERLPDSLEEAAARMLPSQLVSRKLPVGVYWELTERLGDSVSVAVSVIPNRRGLLGRIGQGLSLVGGRRPFTLGWDAEGPGRRTAEALELDLRQLAPGRYRLVIDVRTERASATSERDIELVP